MKTLLITSLILLCTAPSAFAKGVPSPINEITINKITRATYIASWSSDEIDKTGKLTSPHKLYRFKGDFKKFEQIPAKNYSSSLQDAIKKLKNPMRKRCILMLTIDQEKVALEGKIWRHNAEAKIVQRLVSQLKQQKEWKTYSIREQIERSEVILIGDLFRRGACIANYWLKPQTIYRGIAPEKPVVCRYQTETKGSHLFFLQRQYSVGPEFMVMHAIPLKDAAPYLKLLKEFKRTK